jgi:dienelactone hydrolase
MPLRRLPFLVVLCLFALTAGTVPARAEAPQFLELGEDLALEIHAPPGAGPHPAVILMHGCSGLTERVQAGLRAHAEALVDAGYLAVIADSFSRRDKAGGRVCESLGELNLARYYRTKDAFAVRSWLAKRDDVEPAAIFLIGQSNGGSVALIAAMRKTVEDGPDRRPFAGVVAYYPWCGALDRNAELASPLLVLGAEQDDWVPPEGCVTRAADASGAAMEVHVYPGAHHSFDLPVETQSYAGHTVGGDKAATEDSRRRVLAFFAEIRSR